MIPPVVVPAPTFRRLDEHIDHDLGARYAWHIARTWIEHVIVSGPMGTGEKCTPAEREELLDVWLEHVAPERVLATCWSRDDVNAAASRGVRALVMLQAASNDDLSEQLLAVPADGLAYANPRYSEALITPAFVATEGFVAAQPSGVKVSKVSLETLHELRIAAGVDITIMHGSSRNITGSVAAGADLVTAAPLAAIPTAWPSSDIRETQQCVDTIQRKLDTEPDHPARVAAVTEAARQALVGSR